MPETRHITPVVHAPRTAMDGLTRTVFDRAPFGLLVTEAGGTVVAANPESMHLLGCEALAGRTCCALLGCRRPDGVLAGHCVTERALAEERPLPEVRVDAIVAGARLAVWVTASPLGPRQALLHLRPGRPGDRRRRSDPTWTAGPMLHVHVLGRTRVHAADGPLDGPWLRQRPGQLFKLLVANRRRVSHTDEIAMAFWPEGDRKSLQNVRYSVHEARRRLEPGREPGTPSSFVIGHDGGYGVDLDRMRVDADEFEHQARAGLAAVAAGDVALARHALVRAAALYQGEFLADEPYAEWAFAERDRLHDLAGRVLQALTDLDLEAGDPGAALGHLQRLAELEPLDQAVQRRLIALLFDQGRSGEAVRRYRQLQALWQSAFDERLELDLAALRRVA